MFFQVSRTKKAIIQHQGKRTWHLMQLIYERPKTRTCGSHWLGGWWVVGWLGGEAKNLSKHLQSSYHQFKTIRCIAEGLAHAEHHQLLHENSSKHPWGAFEAAKVCSNTSLQRCTQQHPFSINPRYSYSNPLSSKRKSVHQV